MLPSSYSFSNFLWNSVCVYCRCFYFTRPPHWVFSCIPHLFVPLYWNFFISAFHFTKFFPHYFQTPFKNTHRILGNGRVGNSKGLFFHRNKENLTKMIFIRTQRLTATKWSINQKKKKKNQLKHRKRDVWHFNLSLFHPPHPDHWWSVGSCF